MKKKYFAWQARFQGPIFARTQAEFIERLEILFEKMLYEKFSSFGGMIPGMAHDAAAVAGITHGVAWSPFIKTDRLRGTMEWKNRPDEDWRHKDFDVSYPVPESLIKEWAREVKKGKKPGRRYRRKTKKGKKGARRRAKGRGKR